MGNQNRQLTLNFEGGLTRRYKNLIEVVRTGAYRDHRFNQLAIAMDQAPGNLSLMLSGQRHFPLDKLETYIDEFGDFTPIYYLIEKYLRQADNGGREKLTRIKDQLSALQDQLAQLEFND